MHVGDRNECAAGRSRRAPARRSVSSTTAHAVGSRHGADRGTGRPADRTRGTSRPDGRGTPCCGADRRSRLRRPCTDRARPQARPATTPSISPTSTAGPSRAGRHRSPSTGSRCSAARRCRRPADMAPTARSLQARWEDAVARGTPALVTQASPMSRPILGAPRLPRAVRDPHPARRVRPDGRVERVRVSAKADYAIRAAVELAAAGDGPTKGDRIAQAQEIPVNFLENILVDLRNAGHRRQPARGGRRLLACAARRRDQPRRRDPGRRRPARERSRRPLRAGRVHGSAEPPPRRLGRGPREPAQRARDASRSPTWRAASYPRRSGRSPPTRTPGRLTD